MAKKFVHRMVAVAMIVLVCAHARAADYNPLDIPAQSVRALAVQTLDITIADKARQREIPLRIYLPAATSAQPVVLFSHGLGGDREGGAYLGQHWAARGYVAVFLQHEGSDSALWENKNKLSALVAMKRAMSATNLELRVGDVKATLDQLALWNKSSDSPLRGRLDMTRVGMSGHSFGAVTTQVVSGQKTIAPSQDGRIKAAVIMSPSKPRLGDARTAFGEVHVPWLLMTGTKDFGGISGFAMEDRLIVYQSLPVGDKYEIILDGAEHSAFTDRALPSDKSPRNPNHHRVIQALSTAFWDAYLRGDQDALRWLQQGGAESLLDPNDVWQKK